MKKALVAILLIVSACGRDKVNVNCATNETTVECAVQQVQGKDEVEACWDFAITCANNTVVKAPRMCTKVRGGGTETATISADKLIGMDKCGGTGSPTAAMSNLTINGKPATNEGGCSSAGGSGLALAFLVLGLIAPRRPKKSPGPANGSATIRPCVWRW